jgi:hypothetical protein
MPARFVVVHDDTGFTNALIKRLGADLVWFDYSSRALEALESARSIRFLITRVLFDDRRPLGLSLAQLARVARSDVRVIFFPDHSTTEN